MDFSNLKRESGNATQEDYEFELWLLGEFKRREQIMFNNMAA